MKETKARETSLVSFGRGGEEGYVDYPPLLDGWRASATEPS